MTNASITPSPRIDRRASTTENSQLNSASQDLQRTSNARSRKQKRPGINTQTLLARGVKKRQKISRACDACKQRKAKCTRTLPCPGCVARAATCTYELNHGRGRPLPPAPSAPSVSLYEDSVSQEPDQELDSVDVATALLSIPDAANMPPPSSTQPVSLLPSRASPDLGITASEGQYVDPTSGLAFLHRAWKRLSSQGPRRIANHEKPWSEREQAQALAGDKPFNPQDDSTLPIPDRTTAMELVALYFDVCIATYRFLHRPSVDAWLDQLQHNAEMGLPLSNGLGGMKTTILLTILSIAIFHQGKSASGASTQEEAQSIQKSDRLFCAGCRSADSATGYPALDSVQARLTQVLYLLHSSRMNQAWYIFGNALQVVVALGLHRRLKRTRTLGARDINIDYIHSQSCKRAFWSAYILDIYLGVIFGRPGHFHDDDIDQDWPDRVNDEDMTSEGPNALSRTDRDYPVTSLIFHAKISRILGRTSKIVYPVKPKSTACLVNDVSKLESQLSEWRNDLPHILGSVHPSHLMHPFRRQATSMKLAYHHAIVHANRPFLLRNIDNTTTEPSKIVKLVSECILAAKNALEMVDDMARDGTLFYAFWWTHYVTFCALAVIYVWEISKRVNTLALETEQQGQDGLLDLAERCRLHLAHATASNSPSRRYSIILEELRQEALHRSPATGHPAYMKRSHAADLNRDRSGNGNGTFNGNSPNIEDSHNYQINNLGTQGGNSLTGPLLDLTSAWEGWQTTDWLEFDSIALGSFRGLGNSPEAWMENSGTSPLLL